MLADYMHVSAAGPGSIGRAVREPLVSTRRVSGAKRSASPGLVRTRAEGGELDARLQRATQRQVVEDLAAAQSARSALGNIKENISKLRQASNGGENESYLDRILAELREEALEHLTSLGNDLVFASPHEEEALDHLRKAIEELDITAAARVESYSEAMLTLEGALGLVDGPQMHMSATIERLRAEAEDVSAEMPEHQAGAEAAWLSSVVQSLKKDSAATIQASGTDLLRQGQAGPDPMKVASLLSETGRGA